MGDMRPNILLIMSDEHDPYTTGCYGHPCVQTPNLDRFASGAVVYDNAYTNCPICLPARMSFLTGQYVHQINCWDNGSVLAGEIPTFAHYLEAEGYETTLCGRMHINGVDRLKGFGRRLYDDMDRWIKAGAPQRTPEARRGSNSHVTECGPEGQPAWLDYDRTATDLSVRFLQQKAKEQDGQPWLLVTGLMYPHFPLYCPPEYFERYDFNKIVMPPVDGDPIEEQHPIVQQMRYNFRNDAQLDDETTRKALASYYGLVELTDHHVGQMIDVVDQSTLRDNTLVIYCSDHGEMAGMHGVWQKQLFYENACRIPLMIRTPDGQGKREMKNVSLVDLSPTMLDAAGADVPEDMVGQSLLKPLNEDRVVLSEYHAQGMLSAGFMVKKGHMKYCHYVGHEPQLFDVEADPHEVDNLASQSAYENMCKEFDEALQDIVDPVAVDALAKADQHRRLKRK